MKYLSALLVVLAVLTLGTTTLATTATAGEIYAPRNWDSGDGGVVNYGDPDGGGPSGVLKDGTGSTTTTYRNSIAKPGESRLFLDRWIMLSSYILENLVRRNMRYW